MIRLTKALKKNSSQCLHAGRRRTCVATASSHSPSSSLMPNNRPISSHSHRHQPYSIRASCTLSPFRQMASRPISNKKQEQRSLSMLQKSSTKTLTKAFLHQDSFVSLSRSQHSSTFLLQAHSQTLTYTTLRPKFTQISNLKRPHNNPIKSVQHSFEKNVRYLKIYTKTGDKGKSSLYNGERRPKTDPVFQALGDVDELNGVLGISKEYVGSVDKVLHKRLARIQCVLFDAGSNIATPKSSQEKKLSRAAFNAAYITELEDWIDEMEMELPPLTQFILPGGGFASAFLHLARSTCRRAERSTVALDPEQFDTNVRIFLNRLSDFLFVAARSVCLRESKEEVPYQKPKIGQGEDQVAESSLGLERAEEVLEFWFGDESETALKAKSALWFAKSDLFDQLCTRKFSGLLSDAKQGKLDHWCKTPRGTLALVLILDQMPRNIFRNQPQSFESDNRALELMQAAVRSGQDRQLTARQRSFLYMPAMHSENLEVQGQSVQLFCALAKEFPELAESGTYAILHRDVIAKFGRFPHRNAILNRESSSEEQDHLQKNGGF